MPPINNKKPQNTTSSPDPTTANIEKIKPSKPIDQVHLF